MDNNCASVAFPDFTRGAWNKVQGFQFAWAPAEAEAAAEAAATACTDLQKQLCTKYQLWAKYDAMRKATAPKDVKKATADYTKACAKMAKEAAKAKK